MATWSTGSEFKLNIEELNRHDRYTVAIKVSGNTFGHVPRELLEVYTVLLEIFVELNFRGRTQPLH